MKPDFVRTSLDLPKELHKRLHEAAARKGTSARQLILASIEHSLADQAPQRPKKRLSLATAIVASRGKPFDLSHEEIYDLLDSP